MRRGMADSVMRIMPVLYSLLIASTATMATTAWPRSIPVRLTLAGSTWQTTPDGQLVPAAAAAPTATVSAIAASSSHPVLGMVRVLVHSACSARSGQPHTSLRRTRTRARARAMAAQPHSTAKPAQGASGK